MTAAPPRRAQLPCSCGLLNVVNATDSGRLDLLRLAGRPANDDAFDRGMGAKAEVQLALILRAETGAARDFLKLLPSIPEDLDLRTDGSAIRARAAAGVAAAASFQLKA